MQKALVLAIALIAAPFLHAMDLYSFDSCPYCQKVLTAMKTMGLKENLDYNIKDVSYSKNTKELVKLGGKSQVPFLVDGKTKMYESTEIIKYIKSKR